MQYWLQCSKNLFEYLIFNKNFILDFFANGCKKGGIAFKKYL
jgi:hypothetical protein